MNVLFVHMLKYTNLCVQTAQEAGERAKGCVASQPCLIPRLSLLTYIYPSTFVVRDRITVCWPPRNDAAGCLGVCVSYMFSFVFVPYIE